MGEYRGRARGAPKHYAPAEPYLISIVAAHSKMNYNCPVLMLLLEEFNNLEIPFVTLSSVFLVTSDTEVEWMYEIRGQCWNCKITH